MFTGLVEEIGYLEEVKRGSDSSRLSIKAVEVVKDIEIGASIAVNGVCLTVTERNKKGFTADVMAETLDRTNLQDLTSGEPVNLERALKMSDRLDGHIVSGHIDETGKIIATETRDIARIITIRISEKLAPYIAEKGSVAVDGTSLTVVLAGEDYFTVSLIPHTAEKTILGSKDAGETVNLEADMVAKYVERLLKFGRGRESGLTRETLIRHGYM